MSLKRENVSFEDNSLRFADEREQYQGFKVRVADVPLTQAHPCVIRPGGPKGQNTPNGRADAPNRAPRKNKGPGAFSLCQSRGGF